jgi:hypothetical protein
MAAADEAAALSSGAGLLSRGGFGLGTGIGAGAGDGAIFSVGDWGVDVSIGGGAGEGGVFSAGGAIDDCGGSVGSGAGDVLGGKFGRDCDGCGAILEGIVASGDETCEVEGIGVVANDGVTVTVVRSVKSEPASVKY